MTSDQLPVRPEATTALDRVEDWARLSDGERKRRCAEALRDDDAPALVGLLEAYAMTFGRRGLRVSPNTLRSYRRGLLDLLDFCRTIGRKAHQLRRQDALRFARHLEQAGRSPATINNRLSACRRFVKALRWCGMIEADPFEAVSVDDPTPAHAKADPYTRDELARMLAVADPRQRAIVLLGADAGLRAAETAGLRWADVDLRRKRLSVRSGKGAKDGAVAMTTRCAEALVALDRRPDGRVFGVTTRRIQAIFASLCRKAGVDRRGHHALRHSAGTRLYEATRDVLVVARHLRHSSTKTAEIYAHLADKDYRAAVERLAEANGASTEQ